jgi:acyl-coenzyme A thioesterase PaaI-like protein
MEFFTDGESVLSRLTIPAHLNCADRRAHEGLIFTILEPVAQIICNSF